MKRNSKYEMSLLTYTQGFAMKNEFHKHRILNLTLIRWAQIKDDKYLGYLMIRSEGLS
jgi:hypothetical protein